MPTPTSCRIPGRCRARSRAVTGWGPRDYWFPNIRSLPGAALMLICVYYPYVYLLARTAFGQQSATAYLAARTLGQGPWGAFLRVSLPMARPAIAAGVLLAIMETIADYGTVSLLQRPDLLDRHLPGLVRHAGPGGGGAARALPARLRAGAGGARADRSAGRRASHMRGGAAGRRSSRSALAGWRGWAATRPLPRCRCSSGFLLPVAILGRHGGGLGAEPRSTRATSRFVGNSLTLAGVAALVTVAGAVLVGFRARLRAGARGRGRWCSAPGSATRCRAG